jgi:hypothetical protein
MHGVRCHGCSYMTERESPVVDVTMHNNKQSINTGVKRPRPESSQSSTTSEADEGLGGEVSRQLGINMETP